MGHSITTLVLNGDCDAAAMQRYDLRPIDLGFRLQLCHIDHYYAACWQKKNGAHELLPLDLPDLPAIFPREGVLLQIAREVLGTPEPQFAVIMTEFMGGVGRQWAQVYTGGEIAGDSLHTINHALRFLGVVSQPGIDEFDTVGLDRIRHNPEYLEKYVDLADELGV